MTGFLKRLASRLVERESAPSIRPRPVSRFEPLAGVDAAAISEVEVQTQAPVPVLSPSRPQARAAARSQEASRAKPAPSAVAEQAPTSPPVVSPAPIEATPPRQALARTANPAASPVLMRSSSIPDSAVVPSMSPIGDLSGADRAKSQARASGVVPQASMRVASPLMTPPSSAVQAKAGLPPPPQPLRGAGLDAERMAATSPEPRAARAPSLPPASVMPALPRPSRRGAKAEPAEATSIEISIGTVEIRSPAPAPAARPSTRRHEPRLGLQDYLQRRSRERRG